MQSLISSGKIEKVPSAFGAKTVLVIHLLKGHKMYDHVLQTETEIVI